MNDSYRMSYVARRTDREPVWRHDVHVLVVGLEGADVCGHLLLVAGHAVELRLQRLDGR